MAISLKLVCMILALVCFFAAGLNISTPRTNILAIGLFLLTLGLMI